MEGSNLNMMDEEAIKIFLEGSTPEARRALGHLMRNALQPAVLMTAVIHGQVRRELERSLSKAKDIVERISK